MRELVAAGLALPLTTLVLCSYGAQCAFCLLISAAFLGVWASSSRKSARDLEEQLLLPSPRPAQPRGASAGRLALAATAVLVGGAVSALCGLGGASHKPAPLASSLAGSVQQPGVA